MKKLNSISAGIGYIVLTLIIIWLLAGCSEAYRLRQCRKFDCCPTVKDSTGTIIRDSIYIVEHSIDYGPDTAWLQMYFECNDSNNVILSRYEQISGKYTDLYKRFKNGHLTVTSIMNIHDTLYLQQTDHSETTTSDKVVEKPVMFSPTKWQSFLMVSAYILYGLLIIILIIWIVRKYVLKK